MQTILERLQKKIEEAIAFNYKSTFSNQKELLQPEVVQATQSQFGHYQCNNALKLAKALKSNTTLTNLHLCCNTLFTSFHSHWI